MTDEYSTNGNPPNKTWFDKITNAFTGDPRNRDELTDILRESAQRQILDSEALSIMEGAMSVSDMQVREVMIPRSQMVIISTESSISEILPQVIESAHSRFPVIEDSLDNVIGILLAKDLLPLVLAKETDHFDIRDKIRPATFIPESKRLNVLLHEFRVNRNHMAIVLDEYGSPSGLVTIEDVLEQIVGEIVDEHDDIEEDLVIKRVKDNVHVVKALTPIDDFNEYFNTQHSDEEFDTIGGIVTHSFGRLPSRDESIQIGDFTFTVLNADNRRIKLLQVELTEA